MAPADDAPADPDPDAPQGPPPDPPSLWHVFGVGFVVVAVVWLLPAIWTMLRRRTGSPWLAFLGLLVPLAAVGVLYAGLFRR